MARDTEPAARMAGPDDGLGSLPNGLGAAAILAAGFGWFAFGLFDLAGQTWPVVGAAFNIWRPSGPLSGVSTAAIGVWVLAWLLLSVCWRTRNLRLGRINAAAFAMLAAGLLLTFPPFIDLLLGK
jgi:hypothetical protein